MEPVTKAMSGAGVHVDLNSNVKIATPTENQKKKKKKGSLMHFNALLPNERVSRYGRYSPPSVHDLVRL